MATVPPLCRQIGHVSLRSSQDVMQSKQNECRQDMRATLCSPNRPRQMPHLSAAVQVLVEAMETVWVGRCVIAAAGVFQVQSSPHVPSVQINISDVCLSVHVGHSNQTAKATHPPRPFAHYAPCFACVACPGSVWRCGRACLVSQTTSDLAQGANFVKVSQVTFFDSGHWGLCEGSAVPATRRHGAQ